MADPADGGRDDRASCVPAPRPDPGLRDLHRRRSLADDRRDLAPAGIGPNRLRRSRAGSHIYRRRLPATAALDARPAPPPAPLPPCTDRAGALVAARDPAAPLAC